MRTDDAGGAERLQRDPPVHRGHAIAAYFHGLGFLVDFHALQRARFAFGARGQVRGQKRAAGRLPGRDERRYRSYGHRVFVAETPRRCR